VNAARVTEIANAVLYEGYILYPYRASALKNRQRFNFGVVVPQTCCEAGGAGERSSLHTECLVRAGELARLMVTLRFLHAMSRTTHTPTAHTSSAWQEASERDVSLQATVWSLIAGPMRRRFHFVSRRLVEPAAPGSSHATVRRQQGVTGDVEVTAQPVGDGLFRIRLQVSNTTSLSLSHHDDRDQLMMRAFLSTHAILQVEGGEFLSLLDPPEDAAAQASTCSQSGLWPVLVGDEGDRDAMLASPIILYDYPQVAPESAGDFFDGTEIDEMLALRVMTMTDGEKAEMRQVDDHARRILDRTEQLSTADLMRLHGTLRSPRAKDVDP